jgi:hypothetical protein
MKTKIVIGTFFAIVMLAILPSISAVEYNAVKTNVQTFADITKNLGTDAKGGKLLILLLKLILTRKQKERSVSPLLLILLSLLISFAVYKYVSNMVSTP